ncbi:hypothetical protein [Saccharothrix deserti]|uniref:hypothetical protein n=1 Tax=Saccharothrix deserti TaxID=2593674 RepID=UPI00131AB58B|nr:hypothetical protein [Saccharothrix deserti]
MSLTSGLASPQTPLRLFLDRELSAGTRPLRATYRARLRAPRLVLPGDGVGFEAGTVGTAIDQRLRLAFTSAAPVDLATRAGVLMCSEFAPARGLRGRRTDPYTVLAALGRDLIAAISTLVAGLALDDRSQPIARADEDEERLARMLLVAAWYALLYRVPIAFADTPLFKAVSSDPGALTLPRMLAIPHRDLVNDVLAQLNLAEDSSLAMLRAASTLDRCHPGPTFDGSLHVTADADLVVDGLLLDFKSTRRVDEFSKVTMHQLLGYALMDFSDRYEIDAVGVYLTRAGAVISWPIEDYLRLFGARRRDLAEFRAVFATLLAHPAARPTASRLPSSEPPSTASWPTRYPYRGRLLPGLRHRARRGGTPGPAPVLLPALRPPRPDTAAPRLARLTPRDRWWRKMSSSRPNAQRFHTLTFSPPSRGASSGPFTWGAIHTGRCTCRVGYHCCRQ